MHLENSDGNILFCLCDVNAGYFIFVSRFTNSRRPGKKLHCKESTSIIDLKVLDYGRFWSLLSFEKEYIYSFNFIRG